MAEDPSLSAAQIVDQVDCAAACEVEEQRLKTLVDTRLRTLKTLAGSRLRTLKPLKTLASAHAPPHAS